MRKIPAGKLIFIMSVLFTVTGGLRAQDDALAFTPAFLMNSADGIVFYGVNWENRSAEIGRLPDNIGINDPDQNHEWRINARDNFVLSPDSQRIAFVAQKKVSGSTGLFIYDLKTHTLNEAATVESCQELYPPSINWSPDSRLIMSVPGCDSPVDDSRILYRLADQQRLSLPDDYSWGYWLANNTTLLYNALPYDLKLFDTGRQLSVQMASIEHLTVSPLAFPYLHICRFVWSEYAQRWFFESGCASSSENPLDYLYSVDLDGNARLEMSLPDFYSALFPQTDTSSSYSFIDIISVVATDSGLYLIVEVGLERSHWSILSYTGGSRMRPREVFNAEHHDFSRGIAADIAFSPDKNSVAMVDYDGNILIVGLPDGNLIYEIEGGKFDNEGTTYGLRWIDENRLIYTRTDKGIGIFHLGLYDRVDINLAAGLDGEVTIFQQTES